MAGIAPSPQDPLLGRVAEALMGARGWLNSLVNPPRGPGQTPPALPFDVGTAVLVKGPEELQEWSYGNSPFKDKPISGVSDRLPQLQERRVPQVVDALSLAPVGGAAKSGPLFVGAMKPKGGNWLPKVIQDLSSAINRPPIHLTPEELVARTIESERMTANWLNRYAGTEQDPIKDIVWPGWDPWGANHPQAGQVPTLEEITDEAFMPVSFEHASEAKNYGIENWRPGDRTYGARYGDASIQDLYDYFQHVGDTLREVPTEQLKNWDLIRAVKETARRDDLAQKALSKDVGERRKAAAVITSELPVYAQHPTGLNWYRFDQRMDPEMRDLGLAVDTALCEHCVASVGHSAYGYQGHVPQRDLVTRKKVHPSLPDRSGYAEAVARGTVEIYSLRDPKSGEVLATVEARRKPAGEGFVEGEWMKEENFLTPQDEWDIEQIKGPNNRKPSARAIPAIQDFVRNWKRGDVYELENAEMWKIGGKRIAKEEVIQDMLRNGWDAQAIATNPSSVERYAREMVRSSHARDMGMTMDEIEQLWQPGDQG